MIASILLTPTNNEIANYTALIWFLVGVIAVVIILYNFNKKTKEIMGNFATIMVIFWGGIKEFLRDKFGG